MGASLGPQPEAGRWERCPGDPPAPPALARLSPACTQVRGDATWRGWGGHPSTGVGGTPRMGTPGTYLAVAAPRPPARAPSHRGSPAPCPVKPITRRLYGSRLLPGIPSRPSAWHGQGGPQGPPPPRHGRSKSALRGSHRFCTPPKSIPSAAQKPRGRKALSPLPKFIES